MFFEFPAVAKTNTPEIKSLSATFAHPMAHIGKIGKIQRRKNTRKIVHTGAALRTSRLFE